MYFLQIIFCGKSIYDLSCLQILDIGHLNMYWKYLPSHIPSTINFYNNAQPLYIEKILFTLCQFQERRHHDDLSRNGIPASATSRRRENSFFSNSEIFASFFLLAFDGFFGASFFVYLYMIKTILLNFTGEGRKEHGYFWEIGMLCLGTMRGGF